MQKPPASHSAGHVFACYAPADAERVLPELTRLRAAGVNLWFDQRAEAGREAEQALTASDVLLVYLSSHSLHSERCNREIHTASTAGKSIISVYLEPVALSGDLERALGDLPPLFRDGSDRYEAALLRALGAPPRRAPRPTLSGRRNSKKIPPNTSLLIGGVLLLGLAVGQAVLWYTGYGEERTTGAPTTVPR